MQATVAGLLSALFVAAGVFAGPLPSDVDSDFQYPFEVFVTPQLYDIQEDLDEDLYPDYADPNDYEVFFAGRDEDPDEEGEIEYKEEHLDESDDFPKAGEPQAPTSSKRRKRRQSGDRLLDLTSDSPNLDGSRRRLYVPRFYLDAAGNYRNRNNYQLGYSGGVGALLYRSRNGRHSLGASVGGSGLNGNFDGYRVNQSPFRNPRYGIGYTYSFR